MGMSASQARMLSLTARLSDLEFSAQSISNAKIRLSDASADASNRYLEAMDKEKLTVLDSDDSTYIDATARNLTTYDAISSIDKQRFLSDASGRILVTDKVFNAYNASQNAGSTANWLQHTIDSTAYYHPGSPAGTDVGYKSVQDFMTQMLGYSSMDEYTKNYSAAHNGASPSKDETTFAQNLITYYTNLYTGKEDFLNSLGYTSATEDIVNSSYYQDGIDGTTGNSSDYKYDAGAVKYYNNVFDQITEHDCYAPGDSSMNDNKWLSEQLSSGNISLSIWDSKGGEDGKGDWSEVSWASGDSSLISKKDDSEIAKAEAEYNVTLAQIQSKDKKLDMELKSIDTEHNAVQTEIDSVKKVIQNNVERTFKIFNA